jgi:pimeloyl-[acyl-carrier protein] methyl ester esterase
MTGLYTEVRGSGPALVLLHGWGLNLRVWDGLAAALQDRLRIVAIDLPGHGRSPWLPGCSSLEGQAAQIRETICAITESYFLLGWSLGGQIALQLAATRPAGPERLVLIAATPRLPAGPDWPHGAPPERLAQQAASLRTDYQRTVSDFLELQVRGSAEAAAAQSQLRAALFAHGAHADSNTRYRDSHPEQGGEEPEQRRPGQLGLDALACGLELLRETDLRPLLPRITLPTLVIAGQYDRVTLPAASHALAEALPNARYVEIRRAAHAPFLSHLPQLSALLTDFLLQDEPP